MAWRLWRLGRHSACMHACTCVHAWAGGRQTCRRTTRQPTPRGVRGSLWPGAHACACVHIPTFRVRLARARCLCYSSRPLLPPACGAVGPRRLRGRARRAARSVGQTPRDNAQTEICAAAGAAKPRGRAGLADGAGTARAHVHVHAAPPQLPLRGERAPGRACARALGRTRAPFASRVGVAKPRRWHAQSSWLCLRLGA